MPELLQIADYTLRDDAGFAVALPELTLRAGQVAALFGPSGCGKTSMLLALLGLLRRPGWRAAGHAQLFGRALEQLPAAALRELRHHQTAFLVQDAHTALDPLVRVGDQMVAAVGAEPAAVVAMLERLGVADAPALVRRFPHQISGGQAQRVLLAIAFLRRPALVIADEPSASLDGGSYQELIERLQELVAQGSAVLMATHDHRLLRDLGADVYALQGDAFVRAAPEPQPWPERSRAEVGTVPLLHAAGVTVRYGDRAVLDGVDLELRRGEIVALLGESGAGKTTLLRVLAGHRRPDAGRVESPARRTAVQLVCQDAHGSLTPGRRLGALIAEAKAPFFDPAAGASAVHLPAGVLTRTGATMSGGERRRAALLRALAVQPDALLLDEPTASLDRAAAVAVIDNLLTMQRSRALALVVATHDEGLAAAIAHRCLWLRRGELCEQA
ncbi:MAG: ABC transporter ATP-binding protein [Planctomycetes bacterium]|nr:ABC transporter ATP-binding protein [Planctomycetota bacterium]